MKSLRGAVLVALLSAACGSGNGSGLSGAAGAGGGGGTGGPECSSSLDCGGNWVCEPTSGRCVECATAADCSSTETCLGNACRPLVGCASDKACTPMGQLCDISLGICVDCLETSQCSGSEVCSGGGCVAPLCTPGAMRCQGGNVERCAADGNSWELSETCSGATACQQTGDVAACAAMSCTPGATYCQADQVQRCAADGSGASLVEDCGAAGHYCENGACSQTACKPNQIQCSGKDVLRCDEAGSGTYLLKTCNVGEYCYSDGSCRSQWCIPNQPFCSGEVTTVCNADGSGWEDLAKGTRCADQGLTCVYGECKACSAEVGAASLRFIKVFIGKDDYVLVQNTSSVCSADLGGLVLSATTLTANGQTEFTLPAFGLPPKAAVKIFEQTAALQSGSIRVSGAFAFQAGAAGAALLCKSSPCSASNVLDYVTWYQVPSGIPQGITQLPSPLFGMQTWQEETSSYARQKFSGTPPTFYGSDWQLSNNP